MSRTKNDIVKEILNLSEKIFATVPITVPPEWFSSDATIAQLRILLLLHMQGAARMSSIASELDIALPTATGIVDNLERVTGPDRLERAGQENQKQRHALAFSADRHNESSMLSYAAA